MSGQTPPGRPGGNAYTAVAGIFWDAGYAHGRASMLADIAEAVQAHPELAAVLGELAAAMRERAAFPTLRDGASALLADGKPVTEMLRQLAAENAT